MVETMKKQELADGKQEVSHSSVKAEREQKVETPVKKEDKIEKKEAKQEDKKEIAKKPGVKKVKRDEAIVNGVSLPISTLDAMYISKFIKGKTIEKAIADLEEVLKFKRAIPMKGEIPHRKGKGMMSGRYPIKAIGYFIKMLKNLNANAIINGIENGIIVEAIPNRASLPYGRFGSIRRKRTHVKIKVIEKKLIK